jgi:hypothetical protein
LKPSGAKDPFFPPDRTASPYRSNASIEEQAAIERILGHLAGDGELSDSANPSRAPPHGNLLACRFVILVDTRPSRRTSRPLAAAVRLQISL